MVEPRKAFEGAGAETLIVSPAKDELQGWNHFDKAERFNVDVPIGEANADEFDALLLPGGVANPDQLRVQPQAVAFVKRFIESGKPMTSWSSLRTDLVNAGAKWVDQDVVVDRGLVSSRKPADLPAFNRKLIEEIGEVRT